MVVLEGPLMTSPSGHQYLQPDYLSPLPTTLDAKKSPLALLAQTCSQIGADSPPSKPILPPLEKPKKVERASTCSPPKEKPANPPLAFKPYEMNVLTTSVSKKKEEPRRTPNNRKSVSPAVSESSAAKEDEGASPIIRSGLEVMQGKEFKAPQPPLDTNPAFRPPYLYPGWGYARVKTPQGGDALVPVCKDPYCTGCALSAHTALGPCPAGCVQCEQQKYLHSLVPYVRPYLCNWISSDKYCGQRFSSSEELFQHLRSHTSSSDLLRYPPVPNPRYHPYSKPLPLPLSHLYYPYIYPQRLVHP